MEIPESKMTTLLNRLKQNLSDLEKDEVREELKKEISDALTAGGIPARMIVDMRLVFVNLLMAGSKLVHAEAAPGSSILLYLKCESVETLLCLKEMVESGFLLRLFGEVIKEFVESQPEVQLVVKAEDYNLTLDCLAGKFAILLMLQYEIVNSGKTVI